MTLRLIIGRLAQQEHVNFLLTNRIPRHAATRLAGWLSRIEHPLVRAASMRLWRLFAEIDLTDAAQTQFRSVHDCFTRRLRPGARPIERDPLILVSPCDGIVGAGGVITGGEMLQVKGSAYALADLLGDAAQAATMEGARYVTLRLTSGMYHRFHAPHDCVVTAVSHIHGDRWNVNPITLRRVARLFCRNERAIIRTSLRAGAGDLTLVAVAAILVSGIRLGFLDVPSGRRREVRWSTSCRAAMDKGCELGWFEHGSTIIVIAPSAFDFCDGVREGAAIRVGARLMQRRGNA